MSARYFVSRDTDGTVSHLVRINETERAVWGEYFQAGHWTQAGWVMEYLHDGQVGEEISAADAQALIHERGGEADDPAPRADSDAMRAIRAAFADYLGPNGPELPDPVPAAGPIDGHGWSGRFVLNTNEHGTPVLDLFAEHRLAGARHARITGDGSVETFDVFEDHYSFDPDTDESEDQAEERMLAHNESVRRELERKGLI